MWFDLLRIGAVVAAVSTLAACQGQPAETKSPGATNSSTTTGSTQVPSQHSAAAPVGAVITQPADLKVTLASVNGSGCPAGSATIAVTAQGFAVGFANFKAGRGAGFTAAQFRQHCQMAVDVKVPAGVSFAVVKLEANGQRALKPGSAAEIRSSFYFQGDQEKSEANTQVLEQGSSGPFQFMTEFSDDTLTWAPCGPQRLLNISTELRMVGDAQAAGEVSLTNLTAQPGAAFALTWRKCT